MSKSAEGSESKWIWVVGVSIGLLLLGRALPGFMLPKNKEEIYSAYLKKLYTNNSKINNWNYWKGTLKNRIIHKWKLLNNSKNVKKQVKISKANIWNIMST